MNRRTFVSMAPLAAIASKTAAAEPAAAPAGRLKQSLCRWCYSKVPLDELCQAAVKLGLQAMDLLDPKDWPVAQRYGLKLTVVPGPCSIPDGLNRKENHDAIEKRFREVVERAAAAKASSTIIFSGNRRGMSDEEGLDNTVIGLNRIKKIAEDAGLLTVLELLNSKWDHKDYMCDHTKWGVEVMKRVNSPQIKLLYDIYHMQIMEGDVIRTIRDYHQYIGHFHTGGIPGRHEIDDTQELNYHAVGKAIADTGYEGYFAHEFLPTHDWFESLKQAVQICTV
ncbi:MAG: hydroxypyruvate isomerase family protein [Bryobacteraceae bacterium]